MRSVVGAHAFLDRGLYGTHWYILSTYFISLNCSATTAVRSRGRRLHDGPMEGHCAMTMIIGVKAMYVGGLLQWHDR